MGKMAEEYEIPQIPVGYVSKFLIEPINFAATGGLSVEESRWLYHQWVRCAMLNLTEKMHLLLTGEPGGGKSLAGELLKKAPSSEPRQRSMTSPRNLTSRLL